MNSRTEDHHSQLDLGYGGCSLIGTRPENQDAFLVKYPDKRAELDHKGVVACIADGVSCSEHSQKASHTAVMQFITDYYTTPDSWSIKHSASKILTSLNSWLFEQGAKKALTHNGLVTTFSAVIFKSNTAHLFHVGDSRIYQLRDNQLRLLTRDHQRNNFGKGAYLTRALGIDSKLEVDYQTVSIHENDRFLLTTDGVHDYIKQASLFTLSSQLNQDLEKLSETICEQALENGSQDNVSCLILDVKNLPKQSLLEHQHRTLSRTIPPAMSVNNKIDDYLVLKVLYAGSRSHVYLVREETTGKEMVMKTPSMHFSDDREFLKNFSNEYWIGSQLDSHRIMKMYSIPPNSKFVYQLCEWVDGITLRQWMYDNPQPSLESVRSILEQLIKAVRVLQRADMVHRDLKPENVMVTSVGEVKIIDFGAVKAFGLEEAAPEPRDGVPLGAANYIAPEYINTGNATIISDLFSVAVIGYEMLTGKLPYKEMTRQNLQSARHTKWHYRSIAEYRQDIPVWVDLVFKKATHSSASQRYQVLSEFITDLFTPNKALQHEQQERPLLQRNPVMFWKSVALLMTTVALIELLMLI